MRIRTLLVALWRNKTGPLLVSAQVAITLALVVNVAYVVEQRIAEISKPTGLDVDNIFWMQVKAGSSKDYPYANAVKGGFGLSKFASLAWWRATATEQRARKPIPLHGSAFRTDSRRPAERERQFWRADTLFGTDKVICRCDGPEAGCG